MYIYIYLLVDFSVNILGIRNDKSHVGQYSIYDMNDLIKLISYVIKAYI